MGEYYNAILAIPTFYVQKYVENSSIYTHLFDYIPFILTDKARLKNEIAENDVSVAFDSTIQLGEALAMVAQTVDDWVTRQCLT